jgi:hypothetical protein
MISSLTNYSASSGTAHDETQLLFGRVSDVAAATVGAKTR